MSGGSTAVLSALAAGALGPEALRTVLGQVRAAPPASPVECVVPRARRAEEEEASPEVTCRCACDGRTDDVVSGAIGAAAGTVITAVAQLCTTGCRRRRPQPSGEDFDWTPRVVSSGINTPRDARVYTPASRRGQ